MPGPPRPGPGESQVRGGRQGTPARRGRGGYRRDARDVDYEGHQREGLRQSSLVHGADHGRVHRRRARRGLVRAAGNRTKESITSFEILEKYAGVLVRDDYGGYVSYDPQLAGVQQCTAHLLRYLDDAHEIDKVTQVWARQVADVLRAAIKAVKTARESGLTCLDADVLTDLRTRYDQGVAVGISANLSRPWPRTGNHPGLQLANRLHRKADQVWLFTERFDVPPTNNGSESAVRGYKLAVKVSGCWRSLATLKRHCRIRSYLTSSRNHGVRTIDAVRDALSATPWMPPVPA